MAAPTKLGRRIVFGALFGVVLYAGMLFWADRESLLEALEDFPLWLVPAVMGLSLLNYLIRFLKWERYRKLLGIELRRGESLLIYLAGFSMGVTPGKMGEVLKSWLIRRVNGTPIHHSAPIVVAERYTDLLGYLILVAIGGLATLPDKQWVFWATLGLCAVGLVLAGSEGFADWTSKRVRRLPVLWRYSEKVEGSFKSTRILLAPKEILFPTAISVVSWGCECTGFWLVASAFVDGHVDFLFAVFAYAFSAIAGAVAFVFPGGLLITEGALGSLTRRHYQAEVALHLSKEVAQAKAAGAVIITRLCTLWFGVLVGLLALFAMKVRYGGLEDPAGSEDNGGA